MLRFKPEVRIGMFNPHLAELLTIATTWSAQHKVDVQVNSIADAAPGRVADSLHPFDLAIDIEPLGNTPADRQSLAEFFRRWAGDHFDVVFESSHVHVEWDMHRGPLREVAG